MPEKKLLFICIRYKMHNSLFKPQPKSIVHLCCNAGLQIKFYGPTVNETNSEPQNKSAQERVMLGGYTSGVAHPPSPLHQPK
jgi:hypothetical protein